MVPLRAGLTGEMYGWTPENQIRETAEIIEELLRNPRFFIVKSHVLVGTNCLLLASAASRAALFCASAEDVQDGKREWHMTQAVDSWRAGNAMKCQ